MNYKNEKNCRINEEISSPTIRITGDNIESRIIDIEEALKISKINKLDLVEIVPNAKPPVCKMINYQKFLYEKKQKLKEIKKLNKKNTTKIKEIRFTYNTGEHDFNFKLKHALNFLEKGDKVKATIYFSGREIQFNKQGELLLLNFIDKLKKFGKIEQLPKLDKKRMWVLINPKKQ
jgi:translation initiation factor IF-3